MPPPAEGGRRPPSAGLVGVRPARHRPFGRPGSPAERVWAALKAWLANSPTLIIQGRGRQVHAFFRRRIDGQILATAAPHSSPWLPEGYVQNFWEAA